MDETTNLGRGSTEDDVVWQPEATEETTEFVAGYGAEPRFRPGYEGVRDGDFAGEYDDFAADGGPDEVERARDRIEQTRVAIGERSTRSRRSSARRILLIRPKTPCTGPRWERRRTW